jgi:hypothetical protein
MMINLSDETLAQLKKVLGWVTVNASDEANQWAKRNLPAKAEAIRSHATDAHELMGVFWPEEY